MVAYLSSVVIFGAVLCAVAYIVRMVESGEEVVTEVPPTPSREPTPAEVQAQAYEARRQAVTLSWERDQKLIRENAVAERRRKTTVTLVAEIHREIGRRENRCELCALGPTVDVLRERSAKEPGAASAVRAYEARAAREAKEDDARVGPSDQWVSVCQDNTRPTYCLPKRGCCPGQVTVARLERVRGEMDCRRCTDP